MKAKPMTKAVLEQKASAIVNLARAGSYSLIQSMLEADFPEELAEFMLDKVKFAKTSIPIQTIQTRMDWEEGMELPCEVDDTKWFSKIAKENARSSARPADRTRAVILALALVALTPKKSRFRVAAAKITGAEFGSFVASGEQYVLPFEASQIPSLIHILNRGLAAVPNLIRLHISQDAGAGNDLPLSLLSIPEHLKILRIASNTPVSTAQISRPNSLKALEVSAPRVFLDDAWINEGESRQLELRINPELLKQLDSGVAECLMAEGGDLNLSSLAELHPKDAEVLARCSGEIKFNSLELSKEVLEKLRDHRSFKLADRNLIWQFLAPHGVYERTFVADSKFLVRSPYILDFENGQRLDLTNDLDEPVEIEIGEGFICTLDRSFNRTHEVTCRRVGDRERLWGRVIKGANQIIICGDLIVLKENASLSKLSLLNGKILGDLNLDRTAGGSLDGSDFKMSHHIVDKKLLLWSPKQKYQGGTWLAAVSLDNWCIEWCVDLPGITGHGMATDTEGQIVLAIHDKVLRLDPNTGETLGKPARLNGSWPVVSKCYPDGNVIAGCQKGYATPEMKCFDASGRVLWSIPLGERYSNVTARDAAFFKDLILMPFPKYGDNRPAIWIIDRRTGEIIQKIEQKSFDIGCWLGLTCFNDCQIMLIGQQGSALFDGIPSSWI